jgi:CBS domain-containing protein
MISDDEKENDANEMIKTIQTACAVGLQILPPTVLCQSIGAIGLRTPITVKPHTSLQECVRILQHNRIGSLIITDENDKVCGIFTERDCVLKVIGKVTDLSAVTVREVMTPDPIRETPQTTVAFALNLMSNGGFRHVPIVDQDDMPIGIVSVKDIVDYFVQRMMGELFEACEIPPGLFEEG